MPLGAQKKRNSLKWGGGDFQPQLNGRVRCGRTQVLKGGVTGTQGMRPGPRDFWMGGGPNLQRETEPRGQVSTRERDGETSQFWGELTLSHWELLTWDQTLLKE